jgi:hypothetical protein
MQPIPSTLRREDLTHSQSSLLRALEGLIARGRLDLAAVEPVPPIGYIVRPASLSPRLRDWLAAQKSSPRLWMDVIEVGELGSQLFVARELYGSAFALSAWQDASAIAGLLRTNVVGPLLWNTHKTLLLERVVEELSAQFGLVKRPLNSREVAAYAQTEWGILITLKSEQGLELFEYFCLPEPRHFDLPIVAKLGGFVYSVAAFGSDTARIGLCWNGFEDPACLFLQEWLRKNRKNQPTPAYDPFPGSF